MSQSNQHTSRLSLFTSLLKQSLRGDEHDYTQGSIRQAIVLLAIPMILELSLESSLRSRGHVFCRETWIKCNSNSWLN